MYICLCNPFSDRDVRDFLSKQDSKTSVSQAYRSCSGGEKPCCGNCLPELRDMVRDHNATATVRAMEREFQTEEEKSTEPA